VLVPAGLLLGTMFASSAIPAASGYALGAHTAALGSWVLLLPLTSLCACLVARRLVTGGFARERLVRRVGLHRVALHVVPIGVTTTLVVLVVVFLYSTQQGVSGWLEPPLILATFLASTAYAALGFAVGTYLNLLVAGPVALVVPYLVIAFPPAMSTLWLRHMFYVENGCCDVSQTLSTHALSACLLMSCAIILGAAGAAAVRFGRGPHPVATVVLTLGALAGSIGSAQGLGATATDARGSGLKCEPAASGIQLCLWPEHESTRAGANKVLERVAMHAAAKQLALPSELTERTSPVPVWPDSAINLVPAADPATQTFGLLQALAPTPTLACLQHVSAHRSSPGGPFYESAQYIVGVWWATQIGLKVDVAANGNPPDVTSILGRLPTLRPAGQIGVINRTVAQLVTCAPLTDLAALQ
jgi:hypothetical protein